MKRHHLHDVRERRSQGSLRVEGARESLEVPRNADVSQAYSRIEAVDHVEDTSISLFPEFHQVKMNQSAVISFQWPCERSRITTN